VVQLVDNGNDTQPRENYLRVRLHHYLMQPNASAVVNAATRNDDERPGNS